MMNTTTQPGPSEVRLSAWLGRISPTALQDATKAVQAFGCTMAQAAQKLQAFGEAAKVLEEYDGEAASEFAGGCDAGP